MSDIVNLKRTRKAKARVAAETEAASNRFKYGRTKTEKSLMKKNQEADARKLDGHKRDDS